MGVEKEPEIKVMKKKLLHKIFKSKGSTAIVKYTDETDKISAANSPILVGKFLASATTSVEEQGYHSYPERWWLLLTVILLNLANYSHWVAFPSVMKMAAKYYDQDGDTMDLIPTVSYGLGVPCCLMATFVVERFGLRAGLHIGGILTGLGEYCRNQQHW
jgi:hypothetical protein